MPKVLFLEGSFGTRLGLPPLKEPIKFGTFPGLAQFIFVLKNFESLCEFIKKKKSIQVWRRLGEIIRKKFIYTDNPGKINETKKKSRKNGKNQNT